MIDTNHTQKQKVLSLLGRYFAADEIEWFLQHLLNSKAVIVGSTVLEALDLLEVARTSRGLDILVPKGKTIVLSTFIASKGFDSFSAEIYRHYEPFCKAVTTFRKPSVESITLIECDQESVWPHVLACPTTASATIMSATYIVILYPELTMRKLSLTRRTNFPPTQRDDVFHTRMICHGFHAFLSNNAPELEGILNVCPGTVRRLRGGRGIAGMCWSEPPQRMSYDEDFLALAWRSNFTKGDVGYMWQFHTRCNEEGCKYKRMNTLPGLDGYE
ncbi:hypothetical protein VNI00_010353 [Paramarasmius palmivorus]|uniref:Uncharacterized protein n=1 Tax=Paramarasmius palmivorus TaxID=297713 RepID=A0AAW0CKF5_9AGAR